MLMICIKHENKYGESGGLVHLTLGKAYDVRKDDARIRVIDNPKGYSFSYEESQFIPISFKKYNDLIWKQESSTSES